MKKLLFLLAVLLTTALASSAQTAQVATLSHEGTISTFYSANALKDAYAAAVDGDVITLSSGTFSAPSNIQKNITLRGAGMMPDADPTILFGRIELYGNPVIEGIYNNVEVVISSTDARLVKCWIDHLVFNGGTNNTMIQCIIPFFQTGGWSKKSSFSVYNCILGNPIFSQIITATFSNCIINGGDQIFDLHNSTLKNCILISNGNSTDKTFQTSNTASHCYFIGKATNPFVNFPSKTNIAYSNLAVDQVFNEQTTYELNTSYQSSWLGDDGTQVGAHGGMLPFDPTPTNPQITKFNVSPKTTADGMLSIDIEVKAND